MLPTPVRAPPRGDVFIYTPPTFKTQPSLGFIGQNSIAICYEKMQ